MTTTPVTIATLLGKGCESVRSKENNMRLTSLFSQSSRAALDLDHWDESLQRLSFLGGLPLVRHWCAIPVAPAFVLCALLALLRSFFHDAHGVHHARAPIAL